MRRATLLICLISLLAGVVACGSDGDGGDEGLSATAWRSEVNALCRDNRAQVERDATAVAAKNRGAPERELSAKVLEAALPGQKRLLARLEKLRPPQEIRADYDRFLSQLGETLELLPRLARSLRSGKEDPELTTRFTEIAGPTRRFAMEQRITECLTDAG